MSKLIDVIRTDEYELVTVDRVDFTKKKIGKVKRTDEGYLTGEAAIAKVGILTYILKDGSTRRELVTEDTLFNHDSMRTLHMKPVTNTHPKETLLDSKSVKRRKVGTTGENVKRDGVYLVSSLTVTDKEAVDSVDSGRSELSPGYKCQLLMQSGITSAGEKYDAIQLNRKYNHVAICDFARGGRELKLNLDSIDSDNVDGFEFDKIDNDPIDNGKNKKSLIQKKVRSMARFTINRIDYEADQEVINYANDMASKVDSLTKDVKMLKVDIDKKDAELDTTKASKDELQTKVDGFDEEIKTKIDEGVKARTTLVNIASQVLKKEDFAKIDEMSNKDVKVAVIKEKAPNANLDEKTDVYIDARFDATVEGLNFDPEAINRQRKDSTNPNTPHVDKVEKSKKDSEEKMMNSHKELENK
jgi:hypothetical protein